MKITIKDLSAIKALGLNGITLAVYDNVGEPLGDLHLGRNTIEWRKGKKHPGKGVHKTWLELIAVFERTPPR